MPTTICDRCRAHMHYCYQFKQMCRKADTLLKQVPLTGVWPNRLDYPKFPNRFLKVNFHSIYIIEMNEFCMNLN